MGNACGLERGWGQGARLRLREEIDVRVEVCVWLIVVWWCARKYAAARQQGTGGGTTDLFLDALLSR